MSRVDNVILSFSAEDDPIMDQVNAWLREHADGQTFGPQLGGVEEAYGGIKRLEAQLYIAAFNHLPEREFLIFLRSLPWRCPEELQYIVKRQDDEVFEIIFPCEGKT